MPTTHDPSFADFSQAAYKVGVLKEIAFTCEGSKAKTTVAHGLGFTPHVVIPVAQAEGTVWCVEADAADETNVYVYGSSAIAASVFVG